MSSIFGLVIPKSTEKWFFAPPSLLLSILRKEREDGNPTQANPAWRGGLVARLYPSELTHTKKGM